MTLRIRRLPLAGVATAALLATLALAPATFAHGAVTVGEYGLEIGWRDEPAYVAQPNAVQLHIHHHDADESPVTDLGADALKIVVSTAGQDSASMSFTPAFSVEEGWGTPGEYGVELVPTAPGDYTFHITGSIHGTAVDVTMTSGDDSFSPIVGSTDIEFPAKVPNLAEVATRLDRVDARVATLQAADPGAPALLAAQSAANAAQAAADTANQALLIGVLVGGAGLVVAIIALVMAARARRAPSST